MSKTQKLAAFVTTIVVILVLILISRESGRNTLDFVPDEDLLSETQQKIFEVREITPAPEQETEVESDIAVMATGEEASVDLAAADEDKSEASVPLAVVLHPSEVGLTPQPKTYVVAAGDTFIGIAEKVYGDRTKWQVIFEANRKQVPDPGRLPVGQKLVIPPLSKSALKVEKPLPRAARDLSHVVQRGDTLYKLAEKYYGDGSLWKEIHKANRKSIPNPDRLELGQRLVIPGQVDTAG